MTFLIAALVLVLGAAQATQPRDPPPDEAPPMRVMSFNIRYDNPGDAEHAWPKRRALVAGVIRFHEVDVLGVQEALSHQVRELEADLPGLAWVGVGRSDGKEKGEFAPIFYRRDRFELLASGTFWLSPTPETPGSKGWDAALPRVATWARLRDRRGGGDFLAINTHFDHVGELARQQSAKLLVERARALAEGLPVILLGDFNAQPDSAAYRTLAEAFRDAREVSESGHFGPEGTFGTFSPQQEAAARIDYLFVGGPITVRREATLAHHWDGRHASDHWPVFAELVVRQDSEQTERGEAAANARSGRG
jgi:endonuclease/exonuclease/phosphatase family metal-dependent hydrolase